MCCVALAAQTVEVQVGDRVELLVLPKATHICDTTLVDLEIRLADGSKVWNLGRDIVEDLHQGGKGNPHGDRLGNADVWHFLDMAQSRRARRPEGTNQALAGWERTAAEVLEGVAAYALDPANAERLWDVSLRLIGS